MRGGSAEVRRAREKAIEYLDTLPLTAEQRLQLSKKMATFTAAVVRDDRIDRKPYDSLVKLADVFFNGRKA